jgi:hypothetical protein
MKGSNEMLSEVHGGVGLTKDLFGFLSWIQRITGSDVISAYFRFDGTRVSGSERIEIETHKTDTTESFWLSVKELKDYVFVRFPINDSGCYERIGMQDGQYPDPRYWRWVPTPKKGVIVDGNYEPSNARVDFIIVGYRPNAIIQQLQSS